MSHKIQITLSDRQYQTLKACGGSQHSSIAELIRRAVEAEYLADANIQERLRCLDIGYGAWKRPSDFDPAREARSLRKPLGPRPPRP